MKGKKEQKPVKGAAGIKVIIFDKIKGIFSKESKIFIISIFNKIAENYKANRRIWIISASSILVLTLTVCIWNWKSIALWYIKPKEITIENLTPYQKLEAGIKFLYEGNLDKAHDTAIHLLQKNYFPGESYLLLAKTYQAMNKLKESAAAYRIALKYNPYWGDAYIGLSTIAIEQQNYSEALYYLSAGRNINIYNPMHYFNYGSLYYISGMDYKKASENFLMSIMLNPKFKTGYSALISSAKKMKSPDLEKSAIKLYSLQFSTENIK